GLSPHKFTPMPGVPQTTAADQFTLRFNCPLSWALYFKRGGEMPDEKIARICWNSNYWVSPSGRRGKSGDKESYEYITGFGHEEWNFDTDKVVDGYVYGFLQQCNNKTDIHKDSIYNISFYSIEKINSYKNKKWWLGKINSAEVISGDESERVYNIYKTNGWLSEMEADLRKLNLDLKAFKETSKDTFFNIRFKIFDMQLLDEPMEIEKKDPAIPSFYYNLLNKTQDPNLAKAVSNKFTFKPGHNPGKNETVTKSKGGKKDKSLFHNEMQTNIFSLLEAKHKKGNVGTENDLGYQTKVDIVVKDKNGFVFYEIKTSQTAKAALREAIGQILEYAFWPDKKYAKKLVIIAPPAPTTDAAVYIKRLRKEFVLPIFYQQYDVKNNLLKNEI
ncbi:MAG: hypothetical protein P9M03_08800, partial [Candidatus Theseobacter exili]|nr:hypothetical protein [Candidatus Theseobacter exili]